MNNRRHKTILRILDQKVCAVVGCHNMPVYGLVVCMNHLDSSVCDYRTEEEIEKISLNRYLE